MKRTVVCVLLVAAISAMALPPMAPAAANTCWYETEAPPVATPVVVPAPFPSGFGDGLCGPNTFLSSTAPCPPPPFVGSLPGQYCGPIVPAGIVITCTATPGPGVRLDGLVVGLDGNFDGHVSIPAEVMAAGVDLTPGPSGEYSVLVYPGAADPWPIARVIAYPLSKSTTGVVFVGCS